MADSGWLTTGRKLQLKVIFYGLLLAGLTYTVIGLLNGFQYANQLLIDYPIPIIIYVATLIGFIPFYRKNDELIQQIFYQIGWSGAILLVPAASAFLYYNFNPPETGIGRITLTISKILVWITTGMVMSTLVFTQKPSSSEN